MPAWPDTGHDAVRRWRQEDDRVEFTLDHVVLVVPDLQAAAAALERRLGLRASPGGRHPALGTENALVPVGGAYLELVAVADDKGAESTPFGRAALSAREHGARFAGWVARVDDLDGAAQACGGQVVPMSRLTPAGETITWRMVAAERLGDGGAVPPLIRWDDPASAPPFAHAQHPAGIVTLDNAEIGDPDGDVRRLLPQVHGVALVAEPPAGVHALVVLVDGRRTRITPDAVAS
jgi:catechol 2,3-dioxygenase-like lactoylglutathione lyase family enzyme